MRTLAPGRSQVNMIETRKREHSRKPDEQYDLIEACSPGPYLELFARYPRSGWTAWGNEADEDVTPRGITHKGYEGGPILPQLKPNEQSDPERAEILGQHLSMLYKRGRSIRQLAAETGYSIQRVRSLLEAVETPMRPRGRTSQYNLSGDLFQTAE